MLKIPGVYWIGDRVRIKHKDGATYIGTINGRGRDGVNAHGYLYVEEFSGQTLDPSEWEVVEVIK